MATRDGRRALTPQVSLDFMGDFAYNQTQSSPHSRKEHFVRHIILVSAVLCLVAGSVYGNEITLKNSFFGGWKYSLDGAFYHKVGYSGAELRGAMEGNEAAQAQMDKYKTYKIWSAVTGAPAGFLIGWPLGGYIASGEWKDSYTTMYIVAAPLFVASAAFEMSATSKLKKAVRIYNGEEQGANAYLPRPHVFVSSEGGPRIGLVWRF